MCTILCFWATKLRIIFDIPMYNAKKVIVSSLQASLGAELTTSARLYLQWIDAVGLCQNVYNTCGTDDPEVPVIMIDRGADR